MAQLYIKKTTDGKPKALEGSDDGALKYITEIKTAVEALSACISAGKLQVDTEMPAPTGMASEETAAAILAKLITAPSTEAKQDTIKTAIDAITTKLSADPATQTTLAAILAKLIAAPATEAGQQPPATTVTHDSIALTAANTEYSLVIPTGCKKLTFRTVRADGKTPGDDLLYAFVTGKVDHPTLCEHMLLDGGAVYSESNLNLSSKTLYVAGITAGDIVLLEMWS